MLALDIETTPLKVWTWGIWEQNIGLNQIIEPTRVLCFAAKWVGEKRVGFYRGSDMIEQAWNLLDEADAVMTYNGVKFDLPHLHREFVERGWGPPSPSQHIDLLKTARQRFKFPSNKLAYVSTALGLEGKVKHEGFELWTKCMAGDEAAWRRMERYNKRDVTELEGLYERLQPWIPQHPNRALYDGRGGCTFCGAEALIKRGFRHTQVASYQLWWCKKCGGWSKESKRAGGVALSAA